MSRIFGLFLVPAVLLLAIACRSTQVGEGPAASRERVPETRRMDFHRIAVTIDPDGGKLTGYDRIALSAGRARSFRFYLNDRLTVKHIRFRGEMLEFQSARGLEAIGAATAGEEALALPAEKVRGLQLITCSLPGGGPGELRVRYEGTIQEPVKAARFSRDMVARQVRGIISPAGVFLSPACGWYPWRPGELGTFQVEVKGPPGFEVVTQGLRHRRASVGESLVTAWKASHPSTGLHLVMGKFVIQTEVHRGVTVSTYFFPSEQDLSKTYREAVKRYLDLYGRMLGPYPYGKFAVVENFFPTGYGMPSYTLLGRRVLRLPFIVKTSLGHEIAHNWWGNSVFVDADRGNWCEGLTTYVADYHYKEKESPARGREYRLGILRDYYSYVTPESEFPLRAFICRVDRASRAIGYGKGAMVFHMLKRLVGEKVFSRSLRRVIRRKTWSKACWDDFRHAFEAESGLSLAWFFRQWVEEKGAPILFLEGIRVEKKERGYRVAATIRQKGGPYRLLLPVVVTTEGKNRKRRAHEREVEIRKVEERITISVPSRPVFVEIDPDAHIFRRLHTEEVPPLLSRLFRKDVLLVRPTAGTERSREVYDGMIRTLHRETGARSVPDTRVTEADITGRSLFLLGNTAENRILSRFLRSLPEGTEIRADRILFQGRTYAHPKTAIALVMRNPFAPDKVVGVFLGLSPEAAAAAAHKIVHYGKYGHLIFTGGRARVKGTGETGKQPLSRSLGE
jgi:hypothetical protein